MEGLVPISGMGGIGKSQLAIEFAFKNKEKYSIVKWFQADDTATILASIEQFLVEAGLPIKDEKENNIVINVMHSWMKSNSEWLFIFDNVESQHTIEKFIPQLFLGNIIVTTRNPNWSLYTPLTLKELNDEESATFILKRIRKAEDSHIKLLVDRLDGLPLALEQAGAYIYETGLTVAEYIHRFDHYNSQIIRRGNPINYNNTIATTWEISFNKIQLELPNAIKFINICGFFAPDNIRKDFFIRTTGKTSSVVNDLLTSPIEFDDILAILRRFSLIQINNTSFSMHRLVQAVIVDKINIEDQKILVENAWMILSNYIEELEIQRYEVVNAETFSHILSTVSHLQRLEHFLDNVVKLLHALGVYLIKSGDMGRARELLEGAMKIQNKINSNDSEPIANLLISMGDLNYVLGKNEEAITYFNQASECRNLSANTNVSIWNHLVGALLRVGKFQEANEIAHKAYQVYQEKLSVLKFDTIINIFNNLGSVFEIESNYKEAEKCYEYLISIMSSIQDFDKPSLASVYNNLGMLNLNTGFSEKAVEYFNLAVEIDKEWLIQDHPNLARDYNNLGLAYYSTKDFHRARKYLNKALRIQKKLYSDGYFIATTLSNLGMSLEGLGELDKAEQYYKEALDMSSKTIGIAHPETAKCMYNLGGIYQLKEEYKSAIYYLEGALDIDIKAYTENHLEVAKDLGKIGCTYIDMFEVSKAKVYLERSYKIYRNILGNDNVETATALAYLSFTLLFLKQIKDSQIYFERSLQVFANHFGKGHLMINMKIKEYCAVAIKSNLYHQDYISKLIYNYCPNMKIIP